MRVINIVILFLILILPTYQQLKEASSILKACPWNWIFELKLLPDTIITPKIHCCLLQKVKLLDCMKKWRHHQLRSYALPHAHGSDIKANRISTQCNTNKPILRSAKMTSMLDYISIYHSVVSTQKKFTKPATIKVIWTQTRVCHSPNCSKCSKTS